VCGRQAGFRGGYDGVLARSFGRPAVVAECAAPLLKVGGWLVVSEPPRGGEPAQAAEGPRWPPEHLGQFGLEPSEAVHEEFDYRILRQTAPCPDRFPRRNGVPAKKPLF
jgi:16S rRNA (guanine527-N7)-methyltransferase